MQRSSSTLTIEELLKSGESISSIARKHNCSRQWVQQIRRRINKGARIYLYFIQGHKIGYLGQSKFIDNRLEHHKYGKHPCTEALNQRAASIGCVTTSLHFTVDLAEHDLNWWEAYYAQQYRNEGWELVNVAPLAPQDLLPSYTSAPSFASQLVSDSHMKSLTLRLTSPVFDALTEACAIANRKDPEESITVEDYVGELVINRVVELGLLRRSKRK